MSMGDVLKPLRRDSTPERIAAQLRSGIVTGRLAPGQALREVEIARQLGVSRGPVREAFQRLIQEGLLEAHPARGVFVPQLVAGDIADLYLARGAVEIAAAQLLAASGTPEAFADLSAALADLRAAPADDWNELARLDLRLHEVLVRSTGSKRLARMFGTLAAETRLCMVALESFYPRRADLVTEHAEIVEAIQQGDAATRPAARAAHERLRAAARRVGPRVLSRPRSDRRASRSVAAADAPRTAPMEHRCRRSDSIVPSLSLGARRKGPGCAGQAGSSRWRPETTWVESSRYP